MENSNGLIYGKISAIMKECPAIGKDKQNSQQHYNYRGIDDVMNALQNILPKYGVFYVPEVLESFREERVSKSGGNNIYTVLKVKYNFYAEDGSHISAVVQSEGMDSGDKSSNKAMSAACKYALFQVFNIPTQELVDPDATSPEPSVPARQAAAPVQRANPQPKPQSGVKTMDYPGDEVFMEMFELPKNFSTVMTLVDAETITDSKGEFYGKKSNKVLYQTLMALQNHMDNATLSRDEIEELQDKIDAIFLILDNRKKTGSWKKQAA